MGKEQVVFDCIQYKTVWEAEYAAGFSVAVPSVLGTDTIVEIKVIGKNSGRSVVHITYNNGIYYRVAKGKDDISGDYRQYPQQETFDVGRYHVTAKSASNRIFLALWTDDEYTFALAIPHGTSKENIIKLIESLAVTDDNIDESAGSPLKEYSYIFEAEYAVHFAVEIPSVLGTGKIEHIYVIDGRIVELDYVNGIVYRTARGDGDISGIYTDYQHTDKFDVERFHVTAKGNGKLYYVAYWTSGDMCWSVFFPHGIAKESLVQLIASLSAVNNKAQNIMPGGYTSYRPVTVEDKILFRQALQLMGADYEPLLVATQVVAGKNYSFICNANMVTLHSISYLAKVVIFQPLSSAKSSQPVVMSIKKLE